MDAGSRDPKKQVDAHGLFEGLRSDLFRYYDTPFGLADKRVERERRGLLDDDGVVWRQPWIEPIRTYASADRDLDESCKSAGASDELADFARAGLMPPSLATRLYEHQEAVLVSACQGRHAVVTAGTGSGKTEAFLLPILSSLLEESKGWGGGSP